MFVFALVKFFSSLLLYFVCIFIFFVKLPYFHGEIKVFQLIVNVFASFLVGILRGSLVLDEERLRSVADFCWLMSTL